MLASPESRIVGGLAGGLIGSAEREGLGLFWRSPESTTLSAIPRLLMVDDDPMTRALHRLHLDRLGLPIAEAVDGLDALERLRDFRPTVMLLDTEMPGLGGLETAKRAQAEIEAGRLTVIGVSASLDPGILSGARRAGYAAYLFKPVAGGLLRETVALYAGIPVDGMPPAA
jgi:CheY-like chemotaxis protein